MSTHPIILELVACLEPADEPPYRFRDGFAPMLLEGLRPIVDDDDFAIVVRAIAKLALALKPGSPDAYRMLLGVLRDETIAAAIGKLGLGGSLEEVAEKGRAFGDFVGEKNETPIESDAEVMSWLGARLSNKTK